MEHDSTWTHSFWVCGGRWFVSTNPLRAMIRRAQDRALLFEYRTPPPSSKPGEVVE